MTVHGVSPFGVTRHDDGVCAGSLIAPSSSGDHAVEGSVDTIYGQRISLAPLRVGG